MKTIPRSGCLFIPTTARSAERSLCDKVFEADWLDPQRPFAPVGDHARPGTRDLANLAARREIYLDMACGARAAVVRRQTRRHFEYLRVVRRV